MCPRSVYLNIHVILLQILATLPVSTAEPERMFSKDDLTLTEIHSTMSEDRLEALVLLQARRKRVVAIFQMMLLLRSSLDAGRGNLNFRFHCSVLCI